MIGTPPNRGRRSSRSTADESKESRPPESGRRCAAFSSRLSPLSCSVFCPAGKKSPRFHYDATVLAQGTETVLRKPVAARYLEWQPFTDDSTIHPRRADDPIVATIQVNSRHN